MDIALMAYVKNDLIFGYVKHTVHGQRQLHHAQIGGKMSAAISHRVDDLPANLRRQLLQFFLRQSLYVLRARQFIQMHFLPLLSGEMPWQRL